MNLPESTPLLSENVHTTNYYGLSVLFAIVCIIDVFGVFPVVALPKAIIDCGYYGILVVVLVCGFQIYTAILLGRCWIMAEKVDNTLFRKYRYPYSALAEITYGPKISKFTTFLLDVTIFGAGVPNLIVASQNLQLLGMRISGNTVDISFCYWLIIMGTILCPFLWLGSPKDMKLLCSISVVIVLGVLISVWTSILTDYNEMPPAPPKPEPTSIDLFNNIISAYGILVFQFDIHPNVLTIQVDMQRKNKIGWALIGGFSISITMFALTSVLALSKYGNRIEASLLQGLPASLSLHIAAFLVALQLGLSSAVSNSALYQHIEDWLKISRAFNYKRCLVRTFLTFLAICIAESVPRFDLVMSLFGGTLTGPLVFILPPLFFLKMTYLQHKSSKKEEILNIVYNTADTPKNVTNYFMLGYYSPEEPSTSRMSEYEIELMKREVRSAAIDSEYKSNCIVSLEIIFCVFILIFGVIATLLTTYKNLLITIEYTNFSPPCIFNITAATIFIN